MLILAGWVLPQNLSFLPLPFSTGLGGGEWGAGGEGLWVLVVCQSLLGPDWHSGQTGAPSLG